MTNWREATSTSLAAYRQASQSEAVQYVGSSYAVSLLATPIPLSYDATRGGTVIESQRMDWVVRAADLPAGESPKAGDRIEWARSWGMEVYELMPQDTESHAERIGDGTQWLLHSRLVEESPA